jgi:transcriptional regulator with XRE-family HTH domain
LSGLGERLRLARLRRKFSADTVAERAGIARKTLYRAEQGEPAVTLGTYLKILGVLHLQTDLDRLAKDDILGRRLQDLELPKPLRQRGSV